MARDVEFNVTANDKTGNGLAAAERKFKASQKKIEDENKRHADRLGDVLGKGVADGLTKNAPKLAAALGQTFTQAADAAGPLLAGGVAAASPLIAATLSAAISAGVGVGVAGIGVALVSQDARVQAAGKQLGVHFMESLQQDASPFNGPVLKGIGTIEERFDALRPQIQNIFKNSSGFVDPLVDGATRAVAGIVRGVDQLVAKSQPVIDQLGESIGDLGEDFGDFLAEVDTKGATAAIKDLSDGLGTLLDVTGPVLNGLSQVYGVLSKFGVVKAFAEQLLGPIGQLLPLFEGNNTKMTKLTASTDAVAASFQAAAPAADDYATALAKSEQAAKDLTSEHRTLYGSETDVASALADATHEIKENGKNLDLNTKKGRENRTALEDVANSLSANHDAYVKVNGEGAKSAGVAEANRAAFVKLAEKAGYSSTKAKELATSLGLVPTKKEIRLDADKRAAEKKINDVKNQLKGLHNKTISVSVIVAKSQLDKVNNTLNRLSSRGNAFDANDSFGVVDRAAGQTSTTGGPSQPVQVNQALSVSLDGTPFRAYTARQIQASNDRQAWRQRVGTK